MKTIISLLTLLVLTFPVVRVPGQEKPWTLVGQVISIENGDDQPIKLPRVGIKVREFLRSGLTDDQGLFIIQLPAEAKPGQEVLFLHEKPDYEIFFPYRGCQRLPASSTPTSVIEIRMLPKGSKRWKTDKFLDDFIEHERSRSTQQLTGPTGSRFDFEASLHELAVYTGLTEQETRKQLTDYIDRFRSDAANRHRQANAEFLAGNYALAGELYHKAGKGLVGASVEGMRLGAYEQKAAGDSFYNAFDFAKALKSYQDAETTLQLYRTNRTALGLGDYPQSGADRRQLALGRANAKMNLGMRIAGPELKDHIQDAINTYKGLVSELTSSANLQEWALTQNNLGLALSQLASRSEGPQAGKLLNEAVEAIRLALKVRTREQLPQDWAMSQVCLVTALSALASRSEGPQAGKLLNEAVGAHRLALEVYTREQLPQQWAMSQVCLGTALWRLASRSEGPPAGKLLNDAVEAYRLALHVYTREQLPQQWAMTQNNLGTALKDLASRSEGPQAGKLLDEAVEALRLALEVHTREQLPQQWAKTQNHLSETLQVFVTANEFRKGLEQLSRLVDEKSLLNAPDLVALVYVLRVLCLGGLGDEAQAREVLDALTAHVERQPKQFHIPWSFSELKAVVERSKVEAIATHRGFLLDVLDATSQSSRDAILARLRLLRTKK
jgi:tetratricopeptide (TPR) repeat protein